jgi:hypothetical protein
VKKTKNNSSAFVSREAPSLPLSKRGFKFSLWKLVFSKHQDIGQRVIWSIAGRCVGRIEIAGCRCAKFIASPTVITPRERRLRHNPFPYCNIPTPGLPLAIRRYPAKCDRETRGSGNGKRRVQFASESVSKDRNFRSQLGGGDLSKLLLSSRASAT